MSGSVLMRQYRRPESSEKVYQIASDVVMMDNRGANTLAHSPHVHRSGAPRMTNEEGQRSKENREAIEALERFVVDNDDLLALESRIGRFNIFDAIGIARKEIRHSNFLAFILDPAESHGQGMLFLKGLLMDILKDVPLDSRQISPIELDGTEIRGVEIKREWRNIDLLISCKEPRFVVVVENKLDSGEHSNQLSRYQETIEANYSNVPLLYVFLTPDGDDASDPLWVSYSYEQLCRILTRIRNTYENAIGDEVRVFLDHYLNLLKTRFMDDKMLDELCQRIYKNHRQALDVIWERAGDAESPAFAQVVELIEHDSRYDVLYKANKYVDFVPNSWLEWLPEYGPDDWYPFCVQIWAEAGKLATCAFVGPMTNEQQRREIVTILREKFPESGFKATRASAIRNEWNRICQKETVLEFDDDDVDSASIRERLKSKLDELYDRLERIVPIFRPLCEPANKGDE